MTKCWRCGESEAMSGDTLCISCDYIKENLK